MTEEDFVEFRIQAFGVIVTWVAIAISVATHFIAELLFDHVPSANVFVITGLSILLIFWFIMARLENKAS